MDEGGEMDEVITLSSDSDPDDSDVEIISSFTNMTRSDPLPLSAVRVDIDAVNVNIPKLYIDLTDPRWTLPELKLQKILNSSALVVDLTETSVENGTIQETEKLPPDDCQLIEESTNINLTSNKEDCILKKRHSRDPTVLPLQQDCDHLKPKQMRLDSQTQHQKQTDEAHHHTAVVKLRRLPLLETHMTELKKARCSQVSLHLDQLDNNGEAPERICKFRITTLNGPHTNPSLDESSLKVDECLGRQKELENSDEFTSTHLNVGISQHLQSCSPCSDRMGSVATSKDHSTREDESSSSHDKGRDSLQREVLCSKLEHQELDKAASRQSDFLDQSFPASPATKPNSSEPSDLDSQSHTDPTSHNLMRRVDPPPTSEPTPAEDTPEWQSEEVKADEATNSSDRRSIPSEFALSNEGMDAGFGARTYGEDLRANSPVDFLWQEGSNGDDKDRFEMDFRAASREDRQFVCPVTLRKIMSGSTKTLLAEEDKGFRTPEMLCRQSLSLVYSTIDENYPEGTLQLLSDLLQPGYYPPRDITSHLLHGILLDPQCPYHQCVQAFNLLMRTQRHHKADKTSVPWDWELLTSVMANQDPAKRLPCEVVRMLLEYVVQTLEDDFQVKRSISALHQSIAKATLSCDKHFPLVREVIKWLSSAIMNSTEHGEHRKVATKRDEQVRMVSIFQRMLSLALEVDCSPALTSAKLSQELFHMLISNISLRAHRMLLLESLQSKLLRCKLLEHLLDYACPQKIRLPMSLSLVLHFLKYCTLAPDPSDGDEKWQRWEELVHLLWMLLLSYNNAMKGYLCSSLCDQKRRVGNLVYKPDDLISKVAIREAVEAFMSRSQADLGQALPLHMEESLTYLQDYLLDAAQC